VGVAARIRGFTPNRKAAGAQRRQEKDYEPPMNAVIGSSVAI
jgi:hypothetical protein